MQKESYERTEMDIIRFQTEDIILTSNPDEYEGWNPHSGENSGDEYEGWRPH